ncbi:hypothetical protein BC477_02250 [Clavibacter michiganensis subsp. michiganensis]|uniref:Uncharacterized protein n=1 Tax=Clavibacter michiganensis subsp. michiganensis TaxID=33013 RepID=A0A251XJ32_CLAMM|nr:hypothetical protein BC477_02250 [Clavibacter michiganensis subsp. michiganensis]OUE03532.1 hypothetical protein CMMCAS07_01185 [Clavibacter michiganensis subsp. michiganensis]
MTSHTANRTHVSHGSDETSHSEKPMPMIGTTGMSGSRNARGISGRL